MAIGINYTERASRILDAAKKVKEKEAEHLQPLMEHFEHIRLRENYLLDAYYTGDFNGGRYKLYARRKDADKPFVYSAYQEKSTPTTKIGEQIDFWGEYEDEEVEL